MDPLMPLFRATGPEFQTNIRRHFLAQQEMLRQLLPIGNHAVFEYELQGDIFKDGIRSHGGQRRGAFARFPQPQAACSTHSDRHVGASKGSAKYWVSWMTLPFRNSMMLTV
jgi:hypothetical protein